MPRGKILLAAAVLTLASLASGREFLVYFGTYTNALSQGIYVSRLNADTGELSPPQLAAASPSPCFLAVSPDQKFIYAANSVRDFSDATFTNGGMVCAFAIDPASGQLTWLNQQGSGGAGPCHVSVDASGRVLLAANYGSGSLKSFPLMANGAIGSGGDRVLRTGQGVDAERQTSPHAHCIYADPSDHFALACDLGTDDVAVYSLNPATASLRPFPAGSARVTPGAGARHLAFSPDGRFVHVINEMACTVSTFAWDSATGLLTPVATISALPPGVKAQRSFTAAEILAVGPWVYASVRGHESLSVFAADAQTGRLTFRQNISSGGKVPRGLGIDPTGRWLLAGNQNTDNAVEYAIDPATGKLSATGRALRIGSPVDVKFVTPSP
jgi:6-phosphogluconolactonase